MGDKQVYEVLADSFVAEGVDTLFDLIGNGNMYWAHAMAQRPGMHVVHVRHEHCAVAMADGYARATGRLGVASVTNGPGFTQTITALTVAARANVALIVFAGDAPMTASWHVQQLEMGPLALAIGVHYIPIRTVDRLLDNVREAFYVARTERRPVVLGVPEDLQQKLFPYLAQYSPSTELIPSPQRPEADPAILDQAVELIAAAKKPIIIAGRGAVLSGAGPQLEKLGEQCGALLATSLLAMGLFDSSPFAIGIAGAFSSKLARELFAESDLVIGVGAALGYNTTEAGYLYPNSRVIQIDVNPRGLWQGLRVADLHIRADAKAAVSAIATRLLKNNVPMPGFRSPALAKRISADIPDDRAYPEEAGVVDPRLALRELNQVIPNDWDVVVGAGHYFNFAMTHLRGIAPERMHVQTDFGAIGSGLAAAIGVAVARRNGRVLLIEGDGSMLMHVQELETIRRHGIQLLMCILNDGGYGAEAHKFRSKRMDPSIAIHGRGDLAAIARGFGLRGTQITALGSFSRLFGDYEEQGASELWDVHIDEKIPSAQYRRIHFGEA